MKRYNFLIVAVVAIMSVFTQSVFGGGDDDGIARVRSEASAQKLNFVQERETVVHVHSDGTKPQVTDKGSNQLRDSQPVSIFYEAGKETVNQQVEIGFYAKNQNIGAYGRRDYDNQDAATVAALGQGEKAPLFFGIFDGHGKSPDGENVSHYVAQAFPQKLYSKLLAEKVLDRDILNISLTYSDVADAVQKELKAGKNAEFAGGGSTATMALLHYPEKSHKLNATFVNIGDSRGILIRGDEAVFVTKDHKLSDSDEKARIEELGWFVFDGRINGLSISRTFGDFKAKPFTKPIPDVVIQKVLPGDVIVLASDGLWDVLRPNEVAFYVDEFVKEGKNSQQIAKILVEKAASNNGIEAVALLETSTDPEQALKNILIETLNNNLFKQRFAGTGLTQEKIKSMDNSAELRKLAQEYVPFASNDDITVLVIQLKKDFGIEETD